ncbi:MAG TPA: ornithine cyclodeaminase [Acidimicrobiia bacterium]|nr:ornithine cyclodeaminase [Acidimicrobiia bacterium]
MLILDAGATRLALSMDQAIEAMKIGLGDDREVPLRALLGGSMFMPGRAGANTGVKVVSIVPGNPAGIVALFDSEGSAVGLVDGPTLTSIRTGAAAGLATSLLSRPEAKVMAMLGAGAMAADQVAAVAAVRRLEGVRVWSRRPERARELATRLEENGLPATAFATADEAVRGADVISTATPAKSPLFDDDAVRAGTHINAVGAFTPEMCEIPAETVNRSYPVVDDLEAAAAEAGDLIQAGREPVATIADVLAGRHPQIGEDVTLFKSVGIASQDVAAGAAALAAAKAMGIGRLV